MLDILKSGWFALAVLLATFAGCTAAPDDGTTPGDIADDSTGDGDDSGGGDDDGGGGDGGGGDDRPRSDVALNGAGATFPYPLISKWSAEYNDETGVEVNYQSIGSGGGIRLVTEKTVDFAGSDAPLNSAQRGAAPGLVHIPETLGAVTVAFNLPGVSELRLTGPVVADIFRCEVRRWNDDAIADLNPDVSLPDRNIATGHRSDGSGTTFVFTDYLSKVSPEWAAGPGKGTAVSWPSPSGCAYGGKGNEGVAGFVQSNPYSIGYVELAYAELQNLDVAQIQNAQEEWITPSLDATSKAAAGFADDLPDGGESWETVSIVNADAEGAYPIASFTYLLVYQDLSGAYGNNMNRERATELLRFIDWAIHDGQVYAEELTYAPLPDAVVELNEATLRTLTYNGEPLLD